jgi:hypothetical protein
VNPGQPISEPDQPSSELASIPASAEQQDVGQSLESAITSLSTYRFADIPENRPIFADTQTYRYADLPDQRPIFVAQTDNSPPDFAPGKSGPGGRPISACQEKPIEGAILPFNRPLFSSALTAWPTFTLSGERPVAPSSLRVQTHPYLPNSRPMGANQLEDVQELMGFID